MIFNICFKRLQTKLLTNCSKLFPPKQLEKPSVFLLTYRDSYMDSWSLQRRDPPMGRAIGIADNFRRREPPVVLAIGIAGNFRGASHL